MPARELAPLRSAMALISLADDNQKIDIIEAAASIVGGWSLDDYRWAVPRDRSLSMAQARHWGDRLLGELRSVPWGAPLALSTVAQRELSNHLRRRSGVYFTDHRLATHLAQMLVNRFSSSLPIIDPAAGNGILLAALTIQLKRSGEQRALELVQHQLCAADLSEYSLLIARAVVASCLSSARTPWAIEDFSKRIVVGDSLSRTAEEWKAIAPDGFGGVIGNPPWEKLKTTIHEAWYEGVRSHHYGASQVRTQMALQRAYADHADQLKRYVGDLKKAGITEATGELDLYIVFTELAVQLLAPAGALAYLVPAGLIRSKGTKHVRDHLFDQLNGLEFVVHDNRPGYFDIDSRFKFLTVAGMRGERPSTSLSMSHAKSALKLDCVQRNDPVELDLGRLRAHHPDLTLPEVRSAGDWELFCKLQDTSAPGEGDWYFAYARELDMTNDKRLFIEPSAQGLPLVEGRMVHQYRWHAKAYLGGSGRSAQWEPTDLRKKDVRPQFRVCPDRLPPKAQCRYQLIRAGFCDVTGQTNERSMLASIIPAGAVCGNKVPTLLFDVEGLSSEDATYLWVAVANSFTFDWITRRMITTALNQFLLQSIPLPKLGEWVESVVHWSKQVQACEGSGQVSLLTLQKLRSQIDHAVARAYGVSADEFRLMLADFPQIDRSQSDRTGVSTCTVTQDSILAQFGDEDAAQRLRDWNAAGQVGFIPNQFRNSFDIAQQE